MTALTHRYLARCFAEEAQKAGVSYDHAIGSCHSARAVAARRRAIQRIAKETGATPYRISRVWGGSRNTVVKCLAEPAGIAPYDRTAFERLAWAHGHDRAVEIVEGRDAATLSDIARWRALGAKRIAEETA